MTVTEQTAQEEFLKFVDQYAEWVSTSPDQYYQMGYRLDTWQMWATCDGAHGPYPFSCNNPGLHVEIEDSDQEAPFAVRLGPYTLRRFGNIREAFSAAIGEIRVMAQYAIGHQHIFGQPHHETCTVCLPDQMV